MKNTDSTTKKAVGGLLLGGILFLVGGGLHPQPADGIDEIELAVANMAAQDGWYAAHILTALAFVVIGLSLATLIRHVWPDDSRLKTLGWIAVAGCAVGVIDALPHALAETEIEELVAGGSTPLANIHLITQAFATPLFGIGVAVLGVLGARERLLGHWTTAVLAVLGGVAYSLAGPGVALGIGDAAGFFAAGFLIAWFAIISAVIGLVRARRSATATTPVAA